MALFNEDNLKNKFVDLNMSQQSIQTLSLWLIHHKKHSNTVVNIWFKELLKAVDSRKLTFMYLANDVIQNSKKKGPDYNKEFVKCLPKVFEHLGSVRLDDKSKKGLHRLLTVWEERGVFSHSALHSFKRSYEGLKSISSNTEFTDIEDEFPPTKRRRSGTLSRISIDVSESEEEENGATDPSLDASSDNNNSDKSECRNSSEPPPDPELLMQALMDLESAASADADVREKISTLPSEISDPTAVARLTDVKQAEKLFKAVTESLRLLLNYNGRLTEEMESRKKVSKILNDFVVYQKDKLSHTEEILEEYNQMLSRCVKIKSELKAHMQNLPDFSKFLDTSSALAPLPSAGDLFH